MKKQQLFNIGQKYILLTFPSHFSSYMSPVKLINIRQLNDYTTELLMYFYNSRKYSPIYVAKELVENEKTICQNNVFITNNTAMTINDKAAIKKAIYKNMYKYYDMIITNDTLRKQYKQLIRKIKYEDFT